MIALINSLDTSIMLFTQEFIRNPVLDPIMKCASILGNGGAIWIAVGVIMLMFPKTRRAGIFMLLALAVSSVITNLVIKSIVQRPRPYVIIEELSILVNPLSSSSFPSGHSSSSFACATALCLTLGEYRLTALAFLPAALISVSRIYVGVHNPSDVVVGSLIGVLIAWLLFIALRKRIVSAGEPSSEASAA